MNNKYYFIDRCNIGERLVFKYCKNKYILNKKDDFYYLHNVTGNSF